MVSHAVYVSEQLLLLPVFYIFNALSLPILYVILRCYVLLLYPCLSVMKFTCAPTLNKTSCIL